MAFTDFPDHPANIGKGFDADCLYKSETGHRRPNNLIKDLHHHSIFSTVVDYIEWLEMKIEYKRK